MNTRSVPRWVWIILLLVLAIGAAYLAILYWLRDFPPTPD